MTAYGKKRLAAIALAAAAVLVFTLFASAMPAHAAESDGLLDIVQEDDFSYESAGEWKADGVYADIDNAEGAASAATGLLMRGKTKNPNSGAYGNDKMAVYYTSVLHAPYQVEIGLYFPAVQPIETANATNELMVVVGRDTMDTETDSIKPTNLFSVSGQRVSRVNMLGVSSGDDKQFARDAHGEVITLVLDVAASNAARLSVRGADGADLLPAPGYTSLLLSDFDGYFGFIGSYGVETDCVVNYAGFRDAGGRVVYDNFSDPASFRPTMGTGETFDTDAAEYENYVWVSKVETSSPQNAARYLRTIRGNEIVVGVTAEKAESELVWLGQPLTGGVGAEYTVRFDHRNLFDAYNHPSKLGVVLNPETDGVSAGIGAYTGIAGTRTQFPGLVYNGSGTAVGIYGNGNDVTVKESAEAPFRNWGQKQEVTVKMRQTGEALTEVEIRYHNQLDSDEEHYALFEVKQPIGGYFALKTENAAVLSNFRLYDKEGGLLAKSEFSGIDADKLTDETFDWYIGNGTDGTTDFSLYGAKEEKALVVSSRAGDEAVFENRAYAVTGVGTGEPREIIFTLSLRLSSAQLSSGRSFSVVFGKREEGDFGRIELDGDSVKAYRGNTLLKEEACAVTGRDKIKIVGRGNGTLRAEVGSAALETAYGEANDFAGSIGFTASGNAVVRVDSVRLEMRGVRPYADLKVTPYTVVASRTQVSFKPDAYSDPIDDREDLVLKIFIKELSGEEIQLGEDALYTFENKGTYSVRYELVNTAGLITHYEYSFIVRHIGTGEDKVDSLRNNFQNGLGDDWIAKGGVTASGGTVTLEESSSVETKGTMPYFIMYFTVGALGGDTFEITFGNCFDYENAFGIVFKKGESGVTLRNLYAPSAQIAGGFDLFDSEGAVIKLTVMGENVTLSVREKGAPYDSLGESVIATRFAEENGMTYGKIGFRTGAGTEASLRDVRLYSLDSGISIDTENEPSAGPAEPTEPVGNNLGLIVGLSCGAGAAVLAGGAIVFVLLRRKKRK